MLEISVGDYNPEYRCGGTYPAKADPYQNQFIVCCESCSYYGQLKSTKIASGCSYTLDLAEL